MTDLPVLKLAPGREARVVSGHPWVYSNEVAADATLQAVEPGSLVSVQFADGRPIGIATYNPKTLIAARILTRDGNADIDAGFIAEKLRKAVALRETLFAEPFYRLVHAEADGLPATIVDRYGDVCVVQANAAGSDRLLEPLLDALEAVLHPRAIIVRNDSSARTLEGLEETSYLARGALDGPVTLRENGAQFPIELLGGQKTGWFYDQRDNRAFVAKLVQPGARVLDVYTYAGGFALPCAMAGAGSVLAVDRSEPALALVEKAAAASGVAGKVATRKGEAFTVLEDLGKAGERFDIVITDPPAFIKSRKDMNQGLKAYAKLARLAATLVKPGGFFFIASCSYNASGGDFSAAVLRGLAEAKRTGRILRYSGAAADHPVHPFLPETAYLKALTLQLD
jgi:23S rRNA (cytosine1962-C5)-methyltransferase